MFVRHVDVLRNFWIRFLVLRFVIVTFCNMLEGLIFEASSITVFFQLVNVREHLFIGTLNVHMRWVSINLHFRYFTYLFDLLLEISGICRFMD